jgi:hypothetical protein
MKSILSFFSLFVLITLITSCFSTEKTTSKQEDNQLITMSENPNQSIYVIKDSSFDHPTLVIWIEDIDGNYISTIYITKSFASGNYSHEMIGDSNWLNSEGPSYQPAALPYWTYKKGLINNVDLIPTPVNPFVDAYTGATPTSSFVISNRSELLSEKYRILLEINQSGDWNSYWTNDKYPQSKAYKNSAQPSLVYSVVIDNSSSEFFLNPIGHGDPTGTSGKLFTDISTLTTANEILKAIKVSIKSNN